MNAELSELEAAFNAANFQSDALAAALQAMAYYGTDPEQMASVGVLHLAALWKTAVAFIAVDEARKEIARAKVRDGQAVVTNEVDDDTREALGKLIEQKIWLKPEQEQ